MLNEAMVALSEGYEPKSIDRVMKKRGFPVGPITLIDEIGIDVGAHINRGALGKMFKERGAKSHSVMGLMEDKGWLGKKSGKGFYVYEDKKKTVNPDLVNLFGDDHNFDKKADSEVADRLIMMMVNESFYCLQDNILKDAESGDVGAIFGLGFPAFTGGPFMYTHKKGIDNIVNLLNTLEDKFDKRFKPAPILIEYKDQDKNIYDD
ncbi:3-hydroxyacyl-CoA dehydrogenase family protein [Mangrovivirga cuniculi]|uniref:3-hydroxyacyl-CoA dehydrogenase C-terminal domain-containing protein n=1 Tax=Mangrovivirga cuniculi TaxID=2715131 RepID=A0A4D7JK74_9BACT|nr:3-hydroxyacyl-CoA dehydrogenase family protein [Mangrovivirga cuniculi]QCK15353.1 hypothetical protein DCC35_11650 [Mangrovivirga cuniculi]